jgi:hypothetical protein
VESGITPSNSGQAVQLSRGANSDGYWGRYASVLAPQRYISIDWDMLVSPTAGDPFSQVGPFFGVLSFDDHLDRLNPLTLGGMGVEATAGKIFYYGSQGLAATGTIASFNQWHHFHIVLDYSAKNFQAFYDGAHLVTSPFADSNVTAFTDADIAEVVAGNDSISAGLTGTSYVDNFVVRDGLLGDYDLNGIVNTADYTVWKQAFGTTVATAGNGADGNGNGKVDAADYTVWREHLGASLFSGSGSGSLSSIAVPEPSAVVLVLCGLVTATCCRAWRVRREQ